MVVTTKNAVFCDTTPCGSCKNRRFREMYRVHHRSEKNHQAYVLLISLILSILIMEVIRSSETSVLLRRAARRHIPEDGFLLESSRTNQRRITVTY
jgi:hypothetical protein